MSALEPVSPVVISAGPNGLPDGLSPGFISSHRLKKIQSSQVNRSASGRDNIGADLLQRDGVTGLGGADRDSPEGHDRERS